MKIMYTYSTTVIRNYDGDTVTVDIDLGFDTVLRKQTVRLHGVDTPEMNEADPLGRAAAILARDRVRELLPVGSKAVMHSLKYQRGKYGRILANFEIDGPDGERICLCSLLLRERLAVSTNFENDRAARRKAHVDNWNFLAQSGRLKL